jgi:hypothetical protein
MLKIAHRGNFKGKFESYENEPLYVQHAIDAGYDVEVDLWVKSGMTYLGHDKPLYGVPWAWFVNRADKLWIHCKNVEAFLFCINQESFLNYFWHQEDDFALTSSKYIWTFPGKPLTNLSIAVLPETVENWDISAAHGICSDYLENY